MGKKKSKASVYLEYAALRTCCALVNAVPYPLACALARALAWVAVDVFAFKRRRTVERIRSVFPDKTAGEARAIARASLANVLQSGVEMIRASSLDRTWMEKHVRDAALYAARLRDVVAEGKGAVIMVPHCGNWYMAAWCMARFGMPLFAIAAKQRNPLVNAWLERQYGDIRVLTRGEASTLRDILSLLRRGESFAILSDLRVPRKDLEVPFLNGTANISHGAATFAVSTGAPIVVACMRRIGNHHEFDHLATLHPRTDAELDPTLPRADARREEAKRLMREAMALLDGAIRKTPEQWFWYNKRWILEPVR